MDFFFCFPFLCLRRYFPHCGFLLTRLCGKLGDTAQLRVGDDNNKTVSSSTHSVLTLIHSITKTILLILFSFVINANIIVIAAYRRRHVSLSNTFSPRFRQFSSARRFFLFIPFGSGVYIYICIHILSLYEYIMCDEFFLSQNPAF